jgi:hypothetical protein
VTDMEYTRLRGDDMNGRLYLELELEPEPFGRDAFSYTGIM